MKTTEQIKELCSCGMPQSHPIPHIHDMSEREFRIYEATLNSKAETLKELGDKMKRELCERGNPLGNCGNCRMCMDIEDIIKELKEK